MGSPKDGGSPNRVESSPLARRRLLYLRAARRSRRYPRLTRALRLCAALSFLVTNVFCALHVLALQERQAGAALAIDALYPWIGILSFAWFVEAKSWRDRVEITGATSVGLVGGTWAVFAWLG